MVKPYVTDTHSLVWYMTDDRRLSKKAKWIFVSADISQNTIYIPCIVFFELLYLIKKKKINVDFDCFIKLVSSSKNYRVEPLCLPIIENSRKIHKKVVDPWDRLIAATSMHLNAPLISKDRLLRGIGLEVIW